MNSANTENQIFHCAYVLNNFEISFYRSRPREWGCALSPSLPLALARYWGTMQSLWPACPRQTTLEKRITEEYRKRCYRLTVTQWLRLALCVIPVSAKGRLCQDNAGKSRPLAYLYWHDVCFFLEAKRRWTDLVKTERSSFSFRRLSSQNILRESRLREQFQVSSNCKGFYPKGRTESLIKTYQHDPQAYTCFQNFAACAPQAVLCNIVFQARSTRLCRDVVCEVSGEKITLRGDTLYLHCTKNSSRNETSKKPTAFL